MTVNVVKTASTAISADCEDGEVKAEKYFFFATTTFLFINVKILAQCLQLAILITIFAKNCRESVTLVQSNDVLKERIIKK